MWKQTQQKFSFKQTHESSNSSFTRSSLNLLFLVILPQNKLISKKDERNFAWFIFYTNHSFFNTFVDSYNLILGNGIIVLFHLWHHFRQISADIRNSCKYL